jgi:hypothetical protein
LGRDTKILGEILDNSAGTVGTEFTNQPEVEIELRNAIGSVYLKIGQAHKAEEMHRAALATARARLGSTNLPVVLSLWFLSAWPLPIP